MPRVGWYLLRKGKQGLWTVLQHRCSRSWTPGDVTSQCCVGGRGWPNYWLLPRFHPLPCYVWSTFTLLKSWMERRRRIMIFCDMWKSYKFQISVLINEVLNPASKKYREMYFLSHCISTDVLSSALPLGPQNWKYSLIFTSSQKKFVNSWDGWQGREPGQKFQRGWHYENRWQQLHLSWRGNRFQVGKNRVV